MSDLTNKGKQQILRQQMHAMFPYLIKIDWKNGTISRYVNADEDIDFEEYDGETTSTETYEAHTFSLQLPEVGNQGTGILKLSKFDDNTNLIAMLRELPTGKRPTIEITGTIIYTEGQTIDEVEVVYDSKFFLTSPSWGDDTDITFTIKIDEGLEVQMPCDSLNEITCAGVL